MAKSRITQTNHGIDAIIGANCKSLRQDAGVSQEHFAEHLGISYQQVQKYENARNRIAASTLYRMAGILDVPVVEFFEGLELHSQPSRAELREAYDSLPDPLRSHVRAIVQHLSKAARGTP